MLRPDHVIAWFTGRSTTGKTDLFQLLDGLMIGGQVIIGGAERNVMNASRLMGGRNVIGRLTSIQSASLHPDQTTTFDAAAIVQLLMMAKNEAFHKTAEETLNTLEVMLADGLPAEDAIAQLREHISRVAKL